MCIAALLLCLWRTRKVFNNMQAIHTVLLNDILEELKLWSSLNNKIRVKLLDWVKDSADNPPEAQMSRTSGSSDRHVSHGGHSATRRPSTLPKINGHTASSCPRSKQLQHYRHGAVAWPLTGTSGDVGVQLRRGQPPRHLVANDSCGRSSTSLSWKHVP
jgi:hypothetical protein